MFVRVKKCCCVAELCSLKSKKCFFNFCGNIYSKFYSSTHKVWFKSLNFVFSCVREVSRRIFNVSPGFCNFHVNNVSELQHAHFNQHFNLYFMLDLSIRTKWSVENCCQKVFKKVKNKSDLIKVFIFSILNSWVFVVNMTILTFEVLVCGEFCTLKVSLSIRIFIKSYEDRIGLHLCLCQSEESL